MCWLLIHQYHIYQQYMVRCIVEMLHQKYPICQDYKHHVRWLKWHQHQRRALGQNIFLHSLLHYFSPHIK